MSLDIYRLLDRHMRSEHGLRLTNDQLHDIALKADEGRMKVTGGVTWALVNALRHLNTEQLHVLGEAIAKRSGGTYQRPSPEEKP